MTVFIVFILHQGTIAVLLLFVFFSQNLKLNVKLDFFFSVYFKRQSLSQCKGKMLLVSLILHTDEDRRCNQCHYFH